MQGGPGAGAGASATPACPGFSGQGACPQHHTRTPPRVKPHHTITTIPVPGCHSTTGGRARMLAHTRPHPREHPPAEPVGPWGGKVLRRCATSYSGKPHADLIHTYLPMCEQCPQTHGGPSTASLSNPIRRVRAWSQGMGLHPPTSYLIQPRRPLVAYRGEVEAAACTR